MALYVVRNTANTVCFVHDCNTRMQRTVCTVLFAVAFVCALRDVYCMSVLLCCCVSIVTEWISVENTGAAAAPVHHVRYRGHQLSAVFADGGRVQRGC